MISQDPLTDPATLAKSVRLGLWMPHNCGIIPLPWVR